MVAEEKRDEIGGCEDSEQEMGRCCRREEKRGEGGIGDSFVSKSSLLLGWLFPLLACQK